MTKETAHRFWTDTLPLLFAGTHGVTLNRPELDDSDTLSDTDAEEIRAIYHHKDRAPAAAVLASALTATDIHTDEIAFIVRILSEASSRTDYTKTVQEATNRKICRHSVSNTITTIHTIPNPSDIYNALNQRIYGQIDAKKAACMLVYNHLQGRTKGNHAIFAGSSGCGKTEIWRALSDIVHGIVIVDASQLVCGGYKGALHLRDVLHTAPDNPILVFDEADKGFFEPNIGGNGTDYSYLLQNELLKLLDGDTVSFGADGSENPAFTFDGSTASVVLLGSFETLLRHKSHIPRTLGFGRTTETVSGESEITLDDVIQHGHMRRELAGRIGTVVMLNPMAEQDFYNLLSVPSMFPVSSLSDTYGIGINLSDSLKHDLAAGAVYSVECFTKVRFSPPFLSSVFSTSSYLQYFQKSICICFTDCIF